MPKKTVTNIRSIARTYAESALRALVGVMSSENATPAARVAAANSLLDRGWGKSASVMRDDDGDDDELKQKLTQIVRTIVDPENQDGESLSPAAETEPL